MTPRPGSTFSRIFAFAAPACAGLLLWLAVIAPYLNGLKALDDNIETASSLVAALSRAAAASGERKAGVERLKAAFAAQNLTINGKSEDASAALQQTVAALIRDNRGQMRTMQALAATPAPIGAEISVQAQFAAPIDALTDVLLAIDRRRPLIFVREMSVRMTQNLSVREVSPAEPRPPFRDDAVLEVTLRASAFIFSGTAR
ncbi:MAG: type II secretion system protein GspM [Hyphomicrobiales bacterium]|nr:type II secretion system protein GspM [Hyphomicrobiales bacterium]